MYARCPDKSKPADDPDWNAENHGSDQCVHILTDPCNDSGPSLVKARAKAPGCKNRSYKSRASEQIKYVGIVNRDTLSKSFLATWSGKCIQLCGEPIALPSSGKSRRRTPPRESARLAQRTADTKSARSPSKSKDSANEELLWSGRVVRLLPIQEQNFCTAKRSQKLTETA